MDLGAKAKKRDFEAFFKRNFTRKITTAKIEKSADKSLRSLGAATPILLQDPAAKDNGITHAATVPSNLDAATTMRSADTELRNTIELRATASEIAAPKPDLDAKAKKRRFWST